MNRRKDKLAKQGERLAFFMALEIQILLKICIFIRKTREIFIIYILFNMLFKIFCLNDILFFLKHPLFLPKITLNFPMLKK